MTEHPSSADPPDEAPPPDRAPTTQPGRWLPGLVASLRATLPGHAVESIVGGAGWLSLRVDGRFLWLAPSLRLAWLDPHPVPRGWLELLGRHRRSPFGDALREARFEEIELLRHPRGQDDGFRILLRQSEPRWLHLRLWPRPGAIWLTGTRGAILAQAGRMEGAELQPVSGRAVPGGSDPDLDLERHAQRCREQLEATLLASTTARLRRALRQRALKQRRLHDSLAAESVEAERDEALRGHADVLAANLHSVRPGTEILELLDFEGNPLTLRLDPALSPAANLDRLYRRAAKAERKRRQLQARLTEAASARDLADAWLARAEAPAPHLEDILRIGHDCGVDLQPREPGARQSRGGKRGPSEGERLPYKRYRLASGWEVRVGRSARDNDRLMQRHSHGRDLWLHASGVEGSHVVLRSEGREVPRRALEEAAQLAARFSKARHSSTVGVLVTERRHVRKPRKAAPGSVVAERARTVFVEPRIPEGCEPWRRDSEERTS